MTKAHELRELTDDVLADRLSQAKQELWKRRLDLATGQLPETARFRWRGAARGEDPTLPHDRGSHDELGRNIHEVDGRRAH